MAASRFDSPMGITDYGSMRRNGLPEETVSTGVLVLRYDLCMSAPDDRRGRFILKIDSYFAPFSY